MGREAKLTSWVFMISAAASVDETTRVGTSPSFRSITGPNFLDKAVRERCGRPPKRWCKLPMIGSLDGPGGSVARAPPPDLFFLSSSSETRRTRKEKRKEVLVRSMV